MSSSPPSNDNHAISNPQQLARVVGEHTPATALVLAVRQALRTVPLLSLWLDWDEEEALPAVLPTLRPLAASHAMALAQAMHEADDEKGASRLLPGAEEAGLLAADVQAAIQHATGAISRATSVVARRRTQQAFMHTRNACAAAVRAAYAASAGSDPQAAARALAHMAGMFDGWGVISAELALLDSLGEPPHQQARALLGQPLWPDGVDVPGWAREGWQAMREILLGREAEHWQVWTDWYDALLDPGPLAAQLLDAGRARARLQLPEAFWEQGPQMANAAIAQLLKAYDDQQAQAAHSGRAQSPARQPGKEDGQ